MSSLVYVGRVWVMMLLAHWCTWGAGDCVNVCLCQVRICRKVYVIVGITLHKLVLGGLCLLASVKSSVLALICPLLILQIRLMRGSPIQRHIIGSGWILYDIQIMATQSATLNRCPPTALLHQLASWWTCSQPPLSILVHKQCLYPKRNWILNNLLSRIITSGSVVLKLKRKAENPHTGVAL